MYYYLTKKSGTAKSGKWYGFIYALGVNRFCEPEIRKLWLDTLDDFRRFNFSAGEPIEPIFDADGHMVNLSACDNASVVTFPPDFLERIVYKD